jgi:tRNA(fMet)-specific endonuclease VapC
VTFKYLLDTNILSALARAPQGRVADQVAAVGGDAVCTSIVVASEIRYGLAKRGSVRLSRQLGAILDALDVLPFESPADSHYGDLRLDLERRGTPIGPHDMLIAAHALSLGLVVVTANADEFSRVKGLSVENWLERPGD